MEIKKLEPKDKKGLIVVITGNGKGKTTSALGIILRSAGYSMKSCLIQFMKGDIHSGEWDSLKILGGLTEHHATGKGFCGIQGNPYPYKEHKANAQAAIELAREKIISGKYDIVILDEINNALKMKLVSLDQVLGLIKLKTDLMHLVLTGRDAHDKIIEVADTVSEVKEIKHAYQKGIEPQKGIDY